jgi:hypothetical protein
MPATQPMIEWIVEQTRQRPGSESAQSIAQQLFHHIKLEYSKR